METSTPTSTAMPANRAANISSSSSSPPQSPQSSYNSSYGSSSGKNLCNNNSSIISNSSITSLVPGGVVTTQNISTVIKPKGNTNSLQFVKIQPPELSKKAVEQIRIAEETKISRSKIKEVEEEWQTNLLNWKSKRRQQFGHTVEQEPKDPFEASDTGSGRKVKTFAEMMEQRAKSGNRLGFHLQRYIGADDEDQDDGYNDNDNEANLSDLERVENDDAEEVEKPNDQTDHICEPESPENDNNRADSEHEANPSSHTNLQKELHPIINNNSIQTIQKVFNQVDIAPKQRQAPPILPKPEFPRGSLIQRKVAPIPPMQEPQKSAPNQIQKTTPPLPKPEPPKNLFNQRHGPPPPPKPESPRDVPIQRQIAPPLPKPDPSRIVLDHSKAPPAPPIPDSPKSVSNQRTKPSKDEKDRTVLSVSGKIRCSSCKEELGRGAAAFVVESLSLVYHTNCFRCSVCHVNLSNGFRGVDVRVHAGALHCQNCYSKDGLNYSRV